MIWRCFFPFNWWEKIQCFLISIYSSSCQANHISNGKFEKVEANGSNNHRKKGTSQKHHRFVASCQFYWLFHLVNKLKQTCQACCNLHFCYNLLKQLAASLWLTTFDKSTWNKSVDNLQQTCHQQTVTSHANVSWYRLVHVIKFLARCQQTVRVYVFLCCVNETDGIRISINFWTHMGFSSISGGLKRQYVMAEPQSCWWSGACDILPLESVFHIASSPSWKQTMFTLQYSDGSVTIEELEYIQIG